MQAATPQNVRFSQPYGNYGAADDYDATGKLLSSRGKTAKPGLSTYLTFAYFVPCLIFAVVYGSMGSTLHYTEDGLVKVISIIMLVVAIMFFIPAFNAVRSRGESGDPNWYACTFTLSIVAWVLGFLLGNLNYRATIVPYMDIQQLNVYPAVNPSTGGVALMDGGRMTFVEGAAPDLSKSIGFRNLDIYCAAPITMRNETLSSYDFWAVGTNCCSGHGPDFACGEINNANAHSGLRLMREDQRGYFRLAVQQAEASFNIKANHPVFVHWMQDPFQEIQAYLRDAWAYFWIGLAAFAAGNLLMMVFLVFLFSKVSLF